MLMKSLVMCVILSVLQPYVKASDVSEELQLLRQEFLVTQQQMETRQNQIAVEMQQMQQSKEKTDNVLKQQLQEMQHQMTTEREEMQQQMATETQERQHDVQVKVKKMQQLMAAEKREKQQKMSNLEIENFKLKQDINYIYVKLANVVDENQQLSEVVNVLKKDNYDLSLGFQNVSDIVNQAVDAKHNGSFVGFSAYPSGTRDYTHGLTVIFDSVVTNVGSFYTPDTSIFVCGYNGYYLFSVDVHAVTDDEMEAEMIMDGARIAYVYADEAEQDSASNTVVVFCPQFKQVYVRAWGDGNRMWGGFNSMFTGILLLQQ